jgi:hypothetical protein
MFNSPHYQEHDLVIPQPWRQRHPCLFFSRSRGTADGMSALTLGIPIPSRLRRDDSEKSCIRVFGNISSRFSRKAYARRLLRKCELQPIAVHSYKATPLGQCDLAYKQIRGELDEQSRCPAN